MASIVLKDRVKVTATTTGTGAITLGAAATGYQDFSAIGDGNSTYYTIALQSGNEWEVGAGTVTETAGTFTLSRDTVFESSNAGNLVNFSAGTKDVFVTYPAERAIFEEPTGNTLIDGGPITVVGAGVTSYTTFTAVLGEYYGDTNNYAQLYVQNLNDGSEASSDFAAYNDLSDGETFFVDMGVSSSNASSVFYPILAPNAGYVISYGDGDTLPSKLFLGSGDGDVVLFAGGFEVANTAVTISAADLSVTTEADVNVGGALDVTGAASFGGTVLLGEDPTLALQAATKQYVDNSVAAGLTIHEPVRLERGSNLNATYDNGTSGVGATLTNAGTQAALVIDGVTVEAADRILVYGQTTATQNGVYTVTTVGDGSTNWVLTRATDADTYGTNDPTKLDEGAYFYVTSGDTGAGESYVVTTVGTITFGTTAITFSQFSASPTYVGGTNIDISGQTISLTGTVAPTNGGTGVNTVTTGDLLYGSATNTWSKLAKGAAYKSLVMDGTGTNVEWNAVPLNQSGAVSGALGAVHGGTGLSGYTLGDIVYSSATNTLAKLAGNTTTTKTFLTQTGAGGGVSAAPTWGTIAAADVSGLAASATTDTTNAANITSGTLPAARLSGSYTGITGVGTLVAGTWNGSVIAAAYGGTGQSSYAVGDLLYADTSTSLAKLADVATGNSLISGGVGTAPAWGKIGLTTHVSGTLPIANGGTGATDAAGARANLGAGTGNGTVTSVAAGTYLTGGTITTTGTLAVDATSANTASKVVARDASGNFSANTITATLSGNATNVTGTVAVANGGTGATDAAGARTGLGATTVGSNLFTLPNPGAITFPRLNADNTVSSLDAAAFRTAIGAGAGTVTSVAVSGGTTGLTTSGGPITTSGTITLSGTLAVANGGTGATDAGVARTNLGATTLGGNLFTLSNVAAISFPRFNADNTVSSLDAAAFRTAIGAGTSSATGTVTSVGGTGTVSGLSLSGTVTTSGNLTLGGTLAVTPSNFASQTANTVLAAPNGAAGTPTFRAIVAADIPTLNQNTTGSAGSISGFNNPTTAATANTIAYRDAVGDIAVRELVMGVAVQNFTPSSLVAIFPTTNQAVKVDAAGARAFLDVPTKTGSGASGTWDIGISGNAATATTASNASLLNSISAVNLYNNMGDVHGARTSFDATTPSYGFGYRYVQGSTNGPATGATQYYSWYIGLGSEYPATGAGSYGAMFAVDRNSTTPYLSVRYNESNSFSAWRKIHAGYADSAGSVSGTIAVANGGTGATNAATALSNLGAYPASNPNGYTSNTGTVTGVTATAPVSSTGGTTPVISMPAATTSVSGYLTSTDWNTFNGKGNGTVTSVTATSPVASTGGTTPVISMPAASISVSGYLTSTDWNTFNSKGNGTVTSVTATSPVASTGGAAPVISMGAASSGVNGYMTGTYATKLDGIAAGATNVTNTNQLTNGAGFITSAGNAATATTATNVNGGTINNARFNPRTSIATSTASISPDIASFEQYAVSAQSASITINAPTGTPVDGNKLMFRFLDNGTARAITWNATYTAIGVTLPTTTVASKTTYVGCIYNATNARWDVIAVTTQA